MDNPCLEVKNLKKIYHDKTSETLALDNINFTIKDKEYISIIGPSGCGKSTILGIISNIIPKSGGKIIFKKENPTIGYMLQEDSLFPWKTILENCLLGLEITKRLNKKTKQRAIELLTTYGLKDFMNKYPSSLSGGMRQRASLIRTLVLDPDILLLDEPFSALDYQTRLTLSDEVYEIIKKEGKTALITGGVHCAEYVGIETIEEKNKYLREDILNSLKDIKNLIITYKKSDNKKGYYPSTMCNYFRVIDGNTKYCDSYSEVYNKIKLMRGYDKYLKYGVKDDDFDDLYSNFKIDYQSYSNKYSGINRIQDGLTLSYSDMKLYNQCSFRYYLSKILKLDIYEENFSAVIGSTVHYVMQKCLSNNENDTDKYISEYLSDRVLTKKERFFLDKYRVIVKELLDHVLEEKEYSLFNKAMYEKKIQVDFGEKIVFKGIIDKILYYENNGQTYYALIDYKTGQDQIDLKYLKYGLNMQLPIYLYLSKRLEFINPVCVGFYLQRINVKERDYRLIGYSNSDKDVLSIIDNNYDNSKVIKGMKTLKDGSFSKYNKVLSNEEIEDIVKKTEEEIIKVIKMIKNNEFTINPKVIDNIEVGCEYCKFKDICNMTSKDKVIITTTNTEEGDSNG